MRPNGGDAVKLRRILLFNKWFTLDSGSAVSLHVSKGLLKPLVPLLALIAALHTMPEHISDASPVQATASSPRAALRASC